MLARWAREFEPSEADLALAQRSLVDTVAVLFAGRSELPEPVLAPLGDAGRWAAQAHVLDFDDLHLDSTTHISAVCRGSLGIVKGSVLTSKVDLDLEIPSCGASDLMSDALAFMKPGSLLLTGLVHPQAIRTAEMADLAAIVFVRGKTPELRCSSSWPKSWKYRSLHHRTVCIEMCGLLYQAGLEPVMKNGQ